MVKRCGNIEVTSHETTLKAQTYEIECGEDGQYPAGSRVRVRLKDSTEPLQIAEIYVNGDIGRSSKCDMICYLKLCKVNWRFRFFIGV